MAALIEIAGVQYDGEPEPHKWMALHDPRTPPYWLTIRCPHHYIATVHIDPVQWDRNPAQVEQWIVNLFMGVVRDGWYTACARAGTPPLHALIAAAIARPEVAVYRSPEELRRT